MTLTIKKSKSADYEPKGNRYGDNKFSTHAARWHVIKDGKVVAQIVKSCGLWEVQNHETWTIIIKRTFDSRGDAVKAAKKHFS